MPLFIRLVMVLAAMFVALALAALALKLLAAVAVLAVLAFGSLFALNIARAIVRKRSTPAALRTLRR